MYNWGDPYKDLPIETFKFGDKVVVLSCVPLLGGMIGIVESVDAYGVSVKFTGLTMCISFDADDLTHVKGATK